MLTDIDPEVRLRKRQIAEDQIRRAREQAAAEAAAGRLDKKLQDVALFNGSLDGHGTEIFILDPTRRGSPIVDRVTTNFGCEVTLRSRWEEGSTRYNQDWQEYQTHVTGQTFAFFVKPPFGQGVSFDGLRMLPSRPPIIYVGIEAKGWTDRPLPRWHRQVEDQMRVAGACGFPVDWVLGHPDLYRGRPTGWVMYLNVSGVRNVFYSPARVRMNTKNAKPIRHSDAKKNIDYYVNGEVWEILYGRTLLGSGPTIGSD